MNFKIQTQITSDILKKSLFKGSILAGAGALLVLIGGVILPLSELRLWGLPIFIVACTFIGIGLVPYKKLQRLQLSPNEIEIDDEHLTFYKRKKALFQISRSGIEKLNYIEKNGLYGIGLQLKKPLSEQIKFFRSPNDLVEFYSHSTDYQLFFPYFTAHSVKDLNFNYP